MAGAPADVDVADADAVVSATVSVFVAVDSEEPPHAVGGQSDRNRRRRQ